MDHEVTEQEIRGALQALSAFGSLAEGQEALSEASAKARASYEPILNDSTISETHRQHLLARAYTQHMDGVRTKLSEMVDREAASDTADASSVFGIRGLTGDPAQLTMSRRDAADRVSSLFDSRDLMNMLASATRTGDEVLARAVAERATHIGAAAVVNEFTRTRAHLANTVEKIWNTTHRRQAFDALGPTAVIRAMKPRGLDRTPEFEIRRIAQPEQ